jgi:hypothetical protein
VAKLYECTVSYNIIYRTTAGYKRIYCFINHKILLHDLRFQASLPYINAKHKEFKCEGARDGGIFMVILVTSAWRSKEL